MSKDKLQVIILIALILLGIWIYHVIAISLKDFQAGDIGLGVATTTHEQNFDSVQINQTHGNADLVLSAVSKFKKEGDSLILLTGNSQLHSINYYKDSDKLAVYYLDENFKKNQYKFRAIQLSSPNINLQEVYVYYLLAKKLNLKINWLVVGVPYRAFQLQSLRENFADNIQKINLRQSGASTEIVSWYELRMKLQHATNESDYITTQAQVENWLTRNLERHWEDYRYRGNVRSRIKIMPGLLYQEYFSRTSFFAGSESAEELNMLFLEKLVEQCVQDGVKVLIYQPPHPQTQNLFEYDRKRYDACFDKIRNLQNPAQGIYFRSFEKIVPVEYWGLDNRGRLDVFHFRNEGHRILGDSLFSFFEIQMKRTHR